MEFKDKIKTQRKKLGLTLEQLASKLDLSKTTIMRYENGSIKQIPTENKLKLCNVLEIDINKYLDESLSSPIFTKPILGVVKAGYNLLADENLIGYEEVTERENYQGDYFLKVSGNSMTGSHIFDGNLVYVKSQDDVESGQIAVILIGENEVTIKKVIKKDNLFILEATNPAYENKYYSYDEVEETPIKIIGRVLFNKIAF